MMNRHISIDVYLDSKLINKEGPIDGADTLIDFLRAMTNEDRYQLGHIISSISKKYNISIEVFDLQDPVANNCGATISGGASNCGDTTPQQAARSTGIQVRGY